jgi:hypothetical protein
VISVQWTGENEQLTAFSGSLTGLIRSAEEAREVRKPAKTWKSGRIKNDQKRNCETVKRVSAGY